MSTLHALRPRRKAVVVGAGMGGLAAAIELSTAGFDVQLVEAAPYVGGKMRRVLSGASAIDAGPTVLTLRHVFDDLFRRAGSELEAHVTLEPMQVLARHAWADGSRLDLFADPAESKRAIADFAGRAEAEGFERFLAYARRIWETVEGPFVRSQRPTPLSIMRDFGVNALPMLLKIDSRRTVWKALGDFFRDPRLIQLFGRYATYTGCSPFLAPATLNLVAWVETTGVWRVRGGIHELATAMARLFEGMGGTLRLGARVREVVVERGQASGVLLESGERLDAEAVVFAGDVSALGRGLLGAAATRSADATLASDRSLSALTWCVEARASGFDLVHHNVFFGDSSEAEFSAIFRDRRLPEKPTVYICAQDRDDRALRPERDRLLMLVNAPATGDDAPIAEQELDRCRTQTFERLRAMGLAIEPTGTIVTTSPREFEALFPATGGALYGAATHRWTSTLDRPPARTRLPGLYLAGGSAHPGAGVPMAATSGRLAAESVLEDLRSTSTFRRAATSGGTSTR